jgi:BirA family biotin operon repressor/biotin-[acetyl-CoA-carboxylase] ligase
VGAADHPRGPAEPCWPAGWHVRYVASTASTNADLIAAADAGEPDRTALMAGHQTAGRGRLDRHWDAPPGSNLLVSILFRIVPEDPGELTRRVGLGALDAIGRLSDLDAALKWPNDIIVTTPGGPDRKIAGILAQRAPSGPVVVGLGLNVGWAPEGAAKLGGSLEPAAVLRAVLECLDALEGDVHDRYRAALDTIGRAVRVERPSDVVNGTAIDVERDGRLVVVDGCAVTHRIDVGDVVHLRPV